MAQKQTIPVHEAITNKDMDLLELLVNVEKAPLEERNEKGMTPLYNAVHSNWTDGALLLLDHGASVQNAEVVPHTACSSTAELTHMLVLTGSALVLRHKVCSSTVPVPHLSVRTGRAVKARPIKCSPTDPLIHLAVKTGSERLLKELIKRGVTIRVWNYLDEDCLDILPSTSQRCGATSPHCAVIGCMAEALVEHSSSRPDLDKDLLFLVSRSGLQCWEARRFIQKQHSGLQGKMLQLFVACRSLSCPEDVISFFRNWRLPAKRKFCQLDDHISEEEIPPRSVFADILHTTEEPLLDTEFLRQDTSAMHIQALLAMERHLPEDPWLKKVALMVASELCKKGEMVTAVGVIRGLTTCRALYRHEVLDVCRELVRILENIRAAPEIPMVVLMDSMMVTEHCLATLANPANALCLCHDFLPCLGYVFRALLNIMTIFYECKVPATLEELQAFPSHLKNFVGNFPWIPSWDFFCWLKGNQPKVYPCSATLIKNLVIFSEETWASSRDSKDDEDNNSPVDNTDKINDNSVNQEASRIGPMDDTCNSIWRRKKRIAAEVWARTYEPRCMVGIPYFGSAQQPLHYYYAGTALHWLVRSRNRRFLVDKGVLHCFLNHGADLCTKDILGCSVRTTLIMKGMYSEGELFPSLQCLAAAAFMRDGRLRENVQNCRPTAVRHFLLAHKTVLTER